MSLLILAISREVPQLKVDGVRLHFVGDRIGLPDKVKAGLAHAEAETVSNSRLILNVCFNYGGRWDIVQAARKLVEAGQEITEGALTKNMALAHVSDPDLLIRTGDEQRISNFMLWQTAYSEFYFSDKLWPEFDEAALDLAIADFARRERRFGKTSGQLSEARLLRPQAA